MKKHRLFAAGVDRGSPGSGLRAAFRRLRHGAGRGEGDPDLSEIGEELERKVRDEFIRSEREYAREQVEELTRELLEARKRRGPCEAEGSQETAPDPKEAFLTACLQDWRERLNLIDETVRRCDPDEVIEKLYLRGHCHKLWRIRKEILWRDYGIEWKTPAEQHPEICFD